MAQSSQGQTIPIDYQLTTWHKTIAKMYREQKSDFEKLIIRIESELLPCFLELLKTLGKVKTAEAINQFNECKKIIAEEDFSITILIKSYTKFKQLLAQEFPISYQFGTIADLTSVCERDISFMAKLQVLLRNIIKAAEVVFIPKLKAPKNKEDVFERTVRDVTRVIRDLAKDLGALREQYETFIDKLAIEIEEAIKQVKEEEKRAEEEESKKD